MLLTRLSVLQEIAAAKWMAAEEYVQTDFVQNQPVIKALADCIVAYAQGSYRGFGVRQLAGRADKAPQALADGLSSALSIRDHMPDGWENT